MSGVYDRILKGIAVTVHIDVDVTFNTIFCRYFATSGGTEGECCCPRNRLQGHKTNCDSKADRKFVTPGFLSILRAMRATGDTVDCAWPRIITVMNAMYGQKIAV